MFVICFAFKAVSQAPSDPFTIYNNFSCDITVAIEYWDAGCTMSSPCYFSPVGGDVIGQSSSFTVPGCFPNSAGDIHVVLLEIDGVPVSGTPNVGYMDPPPVCINSSAASVSGSYPVGAACSGGWSLTYNGPTDVTFQ